MNTMTIEWAIDTLRSDGHQIGAHYLEIKRGMVVAIDGIPRTVEEVFDIAEAIEERRETESFALLSSQ